MLRVDPRRRGHLVGIIDNLADRIEAATANNWLGEVQALQVSLDAAKAKLTTLDRINRTQDGKPIHLGMPILGVPA
ncbi:hypothetical protein [Streptosporangium lutulentum]|uniref:Uncharacterized protein n=1 Tax=Streptosporangium lutulentum TaxID=1461250 RepID=A0ABT9QN32_9ACTN|nr:hypothetical protein [Streptosporangium lutulentum]MDP9848140.1 hypothetical protein [Streptosporangium lutulentum]